MNKKLELLTKPLGKTALKKLLKNNGRLSVNLQVILSDLIHNDIESFNDLVDERVIDHDRVSAYLSDISYSVVGYAPGTNDEHYLSGAVIINVCADVDLI